MGIYLNPRNDAFYEAVHDDIYVDKTGLIAVTNRRIGKSTKYLCVSRPRGFGKSMAAGMLAAYYSRGCDSRDLFQGLAIADEPDFDVHLNQYDVIYLNIQQFMSGAGQQAGFVSVIERVVIAELKERMLYICQSATLIALVY